MIPVIVAALIASTAYLLTVTAVAQRQIAGCLTELSVDTLPAMAQIGDIEEALAHVLHASARVQGPRDEAARRSGSQALEDLERELGDYEPYVEGETGRSLWTALRRQFRDFEDAARARMNGGAAEDTGLRLRASGLYAALRVHEAQKADVIVRGLREALSEQARNRVRTATAMVLLAVTCLAALLLARNRERHDIQREEALIRHLAQTNDDLNAFAGRIAHDLRAPLTPIVVSSQLIGRSPVDDRVRDAAGRIDRSAKRLGRMIDALLLFARLGTQVPPSSRTPVEPVLRDVVSSFEERAGDLQARIQVDAAPAVAVACEPELLAVILQNLIDNALKHGLDGGQRIIHVSATLAGDSVCIDVRDHGSGIPPEVAARVFEPLFRGPAHSGDGIGLGLAIVKRLVESRQGAISVEPAIEGGSRFRVTLPSSPDEAVTRA